MGIRGSVGRNGVNDALDVQIVQTLLNRLPLEPASPASVTGYCDDQTVFLIDQLQERLMNLPLATGLVAPNSGTWYALNKQSGPAGARSLHFEETVTALQSEMLNFAQRFIKDADVRAAYVQKAEDASRELLQAVDEGAITPMQAASDAQALRNALLDSARIKSSDIGRAAAQAEKATGLSMEALLSKYSRRLFQREFSELATAEQDLVYIEIAKAAGRPNPKFTGAAARLGTAGKGLIVISIAVAVYTIGSSDRPGREAVKQGVTGGAGFLAGMGGGALAGLACGPGAPICVGVGVFVGGLFGALGSDFAFDAIWE